MIGWDYLLVVTASLRLVLRLVLMRIALPLGPRSTSGDWSGPSDGDLDGSHSPQQRLACNR